MIVRIIGAVIGASLLLYVLLLRGLPVLFFIKMVPLLFLVIVGVAFLYAAVTSD
jgi:hypothetical protein